MAVLMPTTWPSRSSSSRCTWRSPWSCGPPHRSWGARPPRSRPRPAGLGRAYAVLEQAALEPVETLNATVDARDPYTAGHSQRVQEIAVSIARELGITGRPLGAISHAGLFHDIGKLGVPDAILTKPAALTDEEYAQMKCHPADGADIVAKFGRLRHAVPLIRHHPERWDGRGYPH